MTQPTPQLNTQQSDLPLAQQLAFVSFNSLGDSLIYVLMADNLRRNGYAVTLFGNVAYQLRQWLPQLNIKPYPAEVDFERVLDDYPFVIISPPDFMRRKLQGELLEKLRQKWLMICQKAPKDWHYDLSKQFGTTLSAADKPQFARLASASNSIRYRSFESESVVEITLDYLKHQMGLQEVSAKVALTPPADLQYRKFAHRIIVSPDSAWPEKKDWPPQQFMKLCRLLIMHGYEPVIVVAPANHPQWQTINAGRYLMPQFDSITELAAFIYESAAVIANDSGNGHLASFLDIPIVTIYRKRNPLYHWRPGWGKGKVVCPTIVLPGIKAPIWRPFISPQKILKALQSLLENDPPLVPRNHR